MPCDTAYTVIVSLISFLIHEPKRYTSNKPNIWWVVKREPWNWQTMIRLTMLPGTRLINIIIFCLWTWIYRLLHYMCIAMNSFCSSVSLASYYNSYPDSLEVWTSMVQRSLYSTCGSMMNGKWSLTLWLIKRWDLTLLYPLFLIAINLVISFWGVFHGSCFTSTFLCNRL
jgi:hypothetical protein